MDWEIFSTEGRIRRTHYLAYLFVVMLGSAAVQFVASLLVKGPAGSLLAFICSSPFWYAQYCIAVRRAHDWGTSAAFVGWMIGANLGGIIFLILGPALGVAMNSAAAPAFMLGGLMMAGGSVMSLILLFAPPSEANEWGLDPR